MDTHSPESAEGRVSHDTESKQASEPARCAHSLESTTRQVRTTTESDRAKDTNTLDNTEGQVRTRNSNVNERGAFTLWRPQRGAGQDA